MVEKYAPAPAERIAHHQRIATALDDMSDAQLVDLVGSSDPQGSTSFVDLPALDTRVFVKRLPLSETELRNRGSTANYFGLPAWYHYRIGSLGFGAWRELAMHNQAHRWVVRGRASGFPLLHAWRALPVKATLADDCMQVGKWAGNPRIGTRIESAASAIQSLVLLTEAVPAWEPTDAFHVEVLQRSLLSLVACMHREGALHLDVHLGNVLGTDRSAFLCDFGLAMSEAFDLDEDERAFYERHRNFDQCTVVTSCVHALMTRNHSEPNWRARLQSVLDGQPADDSLTDSEHRYLMRHGPVALEMGVFYASLTSDLHSPYPAARLQSLLYGSE